MFRIARILLVFLAVVCLGLPAGAALGEDDPVGVWPLSPTPEVVRPFDPPTSTYGAGHRGVDLAGTVGQRVRTALAGTVTYAGMLAGRGVVVVDHGGTRTTYEPVTASVHVGEHLTRGAPIGALALVGSHCFPRACLHWGWIADPDTYLDPLRLVGAEGPVRLLPLSGFPSVGSPPFGLAPAGPPTPFDAWRSLLQSLHLVAPGAAS